MTLKHIPKAGDRVVSIPPYIGWFRSTGYSDTHEDGDTVLNGVAYLVLSGDAWPEVLQTQKLGVAELVDGTFWVTDGRGFSPSYAFDPPYFKSVGPYTTLRQAVDVLMTHLMTAKLCRRLGI